MFMYQITFKLMDFIFVVSTIKDLSTEHGYGVCFSALFPTFNFFIYFVLRNLVFKIYIYIYIQI